VAKNADHLPLHRQEEICVEMTPAGREEWKHPRYEPYRPSVSE